MGKSGRKIKNHEIISRILVLAVIARGLLLPETGNLVLLDEFCDVAVIWIVCIYVIVRVWRTGPRCPFSGERRGGGRYCMYRCLTAIFMQTVYLIATRGRSERRDPVRTEYQRLAEMSALPET